MCVCVHLGGRIFNKGLGCLLLRGKLFIFCLSIDYHTVTIPCSGEAAPAKKSTATEAHKQVRIDCYYGDWSSYVIILAFSYLIRIFLFHAANEPSQEIQEMMKKILYTHVCTDCVFLVLYCNKLFSHQLLYLASLHFL